ncbi:translation elongation factor Ts [Thermomicrobium roseum DSM 5159]|uniref:Elongation factor Ts n=1 Tax=Thermomicrobium roseum (strain ATCC 27502 / DSM 5159 / P-2) TaxID=309801 RepID=B9L001_THERP|nr:translation elongation factor Ts [Thermomicrobium roseum DSM 5159]
MPDEQRLKGGLVTITTAMIKELRERTGAGIMDAKRALEEAGGDMERAAEILRQQGLARAARKAGRATGQGLVHAYIHGGGRIGALIEVNCETDFVARTDIFKQLVHDLAMQVAATAPRYVSVEDIPPDVLEEGIQEAGSRDKFLQQVVLLAQPFIKDPSKTVEEVIQEAIARLGENIRVRRFARFELGSDEA